MRQSNPIAALLCSFTPANDITYRAAISGRGSCRVQGPGPSPAAGAVLPLLASPARWRSPVSLSAPYLLLSPSGSLRKHLERHGELPARLGQIGPVVIHRAGRAAVQVEGVHTAKAQHQLPHLLDGRAGNGNQHQLPGGVDADGGAGRDGGGEAGLLESLLQRGGDSPVLNQPGRAGDDADEAVQGEALRVRRVEVIFHGHRRAGRWRLEILRGGEGGVHIDQEPARRNGYRRPLRHGLEAGDGPAGDRHDAAGFVDGHRGAVGRGVENGAVLAGDVDLIGGPGGVRGLDAGEQRRAAHPDLTVGGDAQGTEAGGAVEELAVHHHMAYGDLKVTVGGEEVAVDHRRRAGALHDLGEGSGVAQGVVHQGGLHRGQLGVHRQHIGGDLPHGLLLMDDGPGGGRGRDGGGGGLLRGGIGIGPARVIPQDSGGLALFGGEDAVVPELLRQGPGAVLHLTGQGGVGEVHQVSPVHRRAGEGGGGALGHQGDPRRLGQGLAGDKVSLAVVIAQGPEEEGDIVGGRQRPGRREGRGAGAFGQSVGVGVGGVAVPCACHVGEGVGVLAGQGFLLQSQQADQHDKPLEPGGRGLQVIAAGRAPEQVQGYQLVRMGGGIRAGGGGGNCRKARQQGGRHEKREESLSHISRPLCL